MMERRRCQRMAPPYTITANLRAAEQARVVDLSPHGALVETSVPLALERTCPLTLRLASGELRLRAVVRSCRTVIDERRAKLVFRAGLDFGRLVGRQRQVLEDQLVEYCLMEVAGRYESVPVALRC